MMRAQSVKNGLNSFTCFGFPCRFTNIKPMPFAILYFNYPNLQSTNISSCFGETAKSKSDTFAFHSSVNWNAQIHSWTPRQTYIHVQKSLIAVCQDQPDSYSENCLKASKSKSNIIIGMWIIFIEIDSFMRFSEAC